MPDESTGFEPEPAYVLDALAGHELTQERLYAAQNTVVRLEAEIARLEGERDGKVRDALLSLAAEFEAEAEDLLAGRNTGLMDRLTAPSAAVCFRAAARMARLRATVDADGPGHGSAGPGKPAHASGAPDGSQRVESDGAA